LIYHCLFEQSGTFKNEFKKLGYEAYDYDILNNFGETDYQIDIFSEIENAYEGKESIFDNFIIDRDYLLAFFPCIRFEDQIILYFKGKSPGQKIWSQEKKLEYDLQLHAELHKLYELITKLSIVAYRKGFPLMIENPRGTQHYLSRYWALEPKLIDKDRTVNGDYYKKPTQYWFINCEPKHNFIFESIKAIKHKNIKHLKKDDCISGSIKEERSLIHPQYASRFIKTYIVDYDFTQELYKTTSEEV